jgi:hypothetical protein
MEGKIENTCNHSWQHFSIFSSYFLIDFFGQWISRTVQNVRDTKSGLFRNFNSGIEIEV